MIKKVAVFGNPSIEDKDNVIGAFMEDHGPEDPILILHGGAKGPATIISELAKELPSWIEVKFAPWTRYLNRLEDLLRLPNGNFNPVVFYLRNKQCLDNCDYAYIFVTDQPCAETDKMIEQCQIKGVPAKVVRIL